MNALSYVTWFDARFTNWMANGQPLGSENHTTTENGAYNLTRSKGGQAVPRNAINPNAHAAPTFFLPTENEWYKAAYDSPKYGGPGVAGYFTYATQSDTMPGNAVGTGTNLANYLGGNRYTVTQVSTFDTSQNYLTAVGAFPNSLSFYGTLDQGGDVYQWNDLDGSPGLSCGLRGGFWAGGAITLQKSTFSIVSPSREANDAGFRLVGGG